MTSDEKTPPHHSPDCSQRTVWGVIAGLIAGVIALVLQRARGVRAGSALVRS